MGIDYGSSSSSSSSSNFDSSTAVTDEANSGSSGANNKSTDSGATSFAESIVDEDDDTIKIPLNALDIKTLRSLQNYVNALYESDQAEKKQRKSGTSKKRTAKDSD